MCMSFYHFKNIFKTTTLLYIGDAVVNYIQLFYISQRV